ncbi:MAG: hypothetical protein DDT31_01013 [Syntrophomonadaceae bacterium]|nr:hypothetical protein [Bacillota bacterium]
MPTIAIIIFYLIFVSFFLIMVWDDIREERTHIKILYVLFFYTIPVSLPVSVLVYVTADLIKSLRK